MECHTRQAHHRAEPLDWKWPSSDGAINSWNPIISRRINPIRRELRFLIEAGATVEVCKNGRTIRAITANMSGGGVLLDFDEPVQLAVGDQVICEFRVVHDADKPLPYWGVGNISRVEDCRIAVEFKGGGFLPLKSAADGAATLQSGPGPRHSA